MSEPPRSRTALDALAVGARAALRAPRQIERGLGSLLEPYAGAGPTGGRVDLSLRAARRGVRALALVPGSPWRNTCLFRSVAECLTLRELGIAARLRLGVRGTSAGGGIDAHAWVEWAGAAEPEQGDRFTPVAPSRRSAEPEPAPGGPPCPVVGS